MNCIGRMSVWTALMASLLLAAAPALAHDLWITLDNFQPEKTAAASLAAYNAHAFPAEAKDIVAAERLDKVLFVAPDGSLIQGAARTDGTYGPQTPLSQKGTYVAVTLPVNGFSTKTTEGYQRGKSKKGLSDVILCRYSEKFAKSVFAVGQSGGAQFAKPLGHTMEIVPLKDPTTLKAGDVLPIKVLLEGKPAATFVYGTYDGFTTLSNTYGYATRTDKEGVAQIQLIHSGAWLLLAKDEADYPDKAECDMKTSAASLTFLVK